MAVKRSSKYIYLLFILGAALLAYGLGTLYVVQKMG